NNEGIKHLFTVLLSIKNCCVIRYRNVKKSFYHGVFFPDCCFFCFYLPACLLTILPQMILRNTLAYWKKIMPFMDGQTSIPEKYHGNITGQQKTSTRLCLLISVIAPETVFYF